jgi:hypothetical protein
VVFLTTFARNTRVLAMPPDAFVMELLRRWEAVRPPKAADKLTSSSAPLRRKQPAVFISYSRTDAAHVKTLFEEVRRVAGDDVAWFDKSAIEPGDEWRQRIFEGVASCQLFLPVVSSSEEERTEGVFIEEWKRAVERARGIDGRAFIVPVVIDPHAEGNLTRYPRAHRLFGHLDFGFAPNGLLTPELEATIVSEVRAFRG